MRILAGDVGGTKSLFGALDLSSGTASIEAEVRYVSREHDDIGSLLSVAMGELGGSFDAVGIGLPGPITQGSCFLPKLGWTVHESDVRTATSVQRARLVNDFVAVGHGLDLLPDEALLAIQAGEPDPDGPRAILGAGTGLGEGYALRSGAGWSVQPSEGGNTSFAPRTDLLCRFLGDLRERIGRGPTWDDVLSGRGLVHLWRFLTEREGLPAPASIGAEMAQEDPAAVVSRHALAGTDAACERALDLFCDCYADEAGNQALRFVATGGVYLAGGITPRVAEKLNTDAFRATFAGDSPLRDLRARIPLYAVLEERVGLIGAAAVASRGRA